MALPHVTVIGAGYVGATTAHLLALKGLADVTLIDVVDGLAQGKALDMSQAAPVEGFTGSVRGTTDFSAMADSRLVILTAGKPRKPGMSRDDLLAANAAIVGPIAAQAGKASAAARTADCASATVAAGAREATLSSSGLRRSKQAPPVAGRRWPWISMSTSFIVSSCCF